MVLLPHLVASELCLLLSAIASNGKETTICDSRH